VKAGTFHPARGAGSVIAEQNETVRERESAAIQTDLHATELIAEYTSTCDVWVIFFRFDPEGLRRSPCIRRYTSRMRRGDLRPPRITTAEDVTEIVPLAGRRLRWATPDG
jgi:hypothetical protein